MNETLYFSLNMGYSNCSDFSPLFKKKKALGVILFKIQICDPELKFNKVA